MCDTSLVAFHEILKRLMDEKEDANAKIYEKRCRDKKTRCASFIDLKRRAFKLKESNARSKAIEDESSLLAEETGSCRRLDPKDDA
jgi:hypothetical protein